MESKVSGHWTDEQLIEYLYGVGPEGSHLDTCRDCHERLSAMQARRQAMELNLPSHEEAGFQFLAAQRRKIYARLTERSSWWSEFQLRRWASAAAMALVLGGGLVVYEENHRHQLLENKVSDAQLAQDVSLMAQDSEPQPTAPLQALFDE